MLRSKFHRLLFGIWIPYLAIVVSVFYPVLHEGFGLRLFLWNCMPSTIGLFLVLATLSKSRSQMVASASFAIVAAIATVFLVAAWFFTSLDTDPPSLTTKVVFVFGPLFSLALAILASAIGWFAAKVRP